MWAQSSSEIMAASLGDSVCAARPAGGGGARAWDARRRSDSGRAGPGPRESGERDSGTEPGAGWEAWDHGNPPGLRAGKQPTPWAVQKRRELVDPDASLSAFADGDTGPGAGHDCAGRTESSGAPPRL